MAEKLRRYVPWALGALALAFVLYLWLGRPKGTTSEEEDDLEPGVDRSSVVKVATSIGGHADLFRVAIAKDFFAKEGLKIKLVKSPNSQRALEDAVNQRVDLSVIGDIPLGLMAFQESRFNIVATIARSKQDMAVLARKDAGATKIEDLRGKRIGIEDQMSAHFAVEVLLQRHGLTSADVTLVEAKGKALADSLAKGDVAAIVDAFPDRHDFMRVAKEKSEGAVSLDERDAFFLHGCLVTSPETLRKRPEMFRKVLRALGEAAEFTQKHRSEAMTVVVKASENDRRKVTRDWHKVVFDVALDNALLEALEAQGTWYQDAKINKNRAKAPAYGPLIQADALREVKPDKVTLGR